jgi:GR25 family glycosyltransferase involved in LPS biosynthesis
VLGRDFSGWYINLDRSLTRRASVEDQLAAAGCADRYERFAAVDGATAPHGGSPLSPGALGCFLSHARIILRHAERNDGRPLHIMEDDVVLSRRHLHFLDQIAMPAVDRFDIVFTDVSINFNLILLLSTLKHYRLTGLPEPGPPGEPPQPRAMIHQLLNGQQFGGSSSYLVSPQGLTRLAERLEAALVAGPQLPIDMFYVHLLQIDALRGVCTVPFLTSILPPDRCETTIADGMSAMDTVSYLSRAPFFVDRDDDTIRRLSAGLAEGLAPEPYVEPMLTTMRYLFSERFSLF